MHNIVKIKALWFWISPLKCCKVITPVLYLHFGIVKMTMLTTQKSLLLKHASVSPPHIPPLSLNLISKPHLHLVHYLEHVTLPPLWLAEDSSRCYSFWGRHSQLPADLPAVPLMLLHGKVVPSALGRDSVARTIQSLHCCVGTPEPWKPKRKAGSCRQHRWINSLRVRVALSFRICFGEALMLE